MKYLEEFRVPELVTAELERVNTLASQVWTIMEVCGGQTHSIIKHGIQDVLSENIRLVHGPGCPVCVTPQADIDLALSLVRDPGVIMCSFGDMLRVPGSVVSADATPEKPSDLLTAKALGADIRAVYSPLDAVELALKMPQRQIVFFAVGFETTAPANALAILQARNAGLLNFSMLVSQVLVPPAIKTILAAPDNEVQGFLAAGHVCSVMGLSQYHELARSFEVPIVVTGFEPLDILRGLRGCIELLEQGHFRVENNYERAVRPAGNERAQAVINEVFEPCDAPWRGFGVISNGGLKLRSAYQDFDAKLKFSSATVPQDSSNECQSGLILRGKMRPPQCPQFGKTCTPDSPLGAPMVSNEGACAAYFLYGQKQKDSPDPNSIRASHLDMGAEVL
jgi:hydrogenase expression/formation protein HypD